MQTFFETQDNLSIILEQAQRTGEVRIQRADGQTFVLKSENPKRSPFDVAGVDLGISANEIVDFVREGRERTR